MLFKPLNQPSNVTLQRNERGGIYLQQTSVRFEIVTAAVELSIVCWVYLCPTYKPHVLGVQSCAMHPPPPPNNPSRAPQDCLPPSQAWKAAGNSAVLWFLLHSDNTCTWLLALVSSRVTDSVWCKFTVFPQEESYATPPPLHPLMLCSKIRG